ncbi:hypothetical protein [Paraburkholderia sp. MM5477-R1]|uniref:hypothetical protein n=1 Tax=Paraburkholderia sp. MM5477-R1 TaxID=2991062 RepID=UPI003D24F0D8
MARCVLPASDVIQRWRIEEAFKRLKHRSNLEHVSGLSQHAVVQDLAAKVLCDNLQALTTLTAHACHELPPGRRINRAYVHSVLKPLLPYLLLGIAAATSLADALALVARHTFRHRPGNLKATETPLETPQIHDAKALLKDLHFLTWMDWGSGGRLSFATVFCLETA